jgi:hypothetical protein
MQLSKLEILIWFSLLIIEHWTPLHQTPNIIPHSCMELSNFCDIGSTKWKATNVICASRVEEQCVRIRAMLFVLQETRNNVWEFNLLWVLNYLLTDTSTLKPKPLKPKPKSLTENQHWLFCILLKVFIEPILIPIRTINYVFHTRYLYWWSLIRF